MHRFVMPAFSDHVVCHDWRANWKAEWKNPFGSLEPGYLYRWQEYGRTGPEPIGRFEEIQEFLLDRVMHLYENPDHGWALYPDPWDQELFPGPNEALEIKLDQARVPFSISDVPVTTTYTNRNPDGTLHMENRTETRRIVVPAPGHELRGLAGLLSKDSVS